MEISKKNNENRGTFISSIEKFMAISKALHNKTPLSECPYISDIFTLSGDLETIPKKVRNQVIGLMNYKILNAGETLISESTDLKDFYVLIEGKLIMMPMGAKFEQMVFLHNLYKKREVKKWAQISKMPKKKQPAMSEGLISLGNLVGQLYAISQSKWKIATVFALEPSIVISIPHDPVARLIKVFLYFKSDGIGS